MFFIPRWWSNGYDSGLPSPVSGFETAFFATQNQRSWRKSRPAHFIKMVEMQTILIFAWVWSAMIANGFWEAYVEGKHAWDEGKFGWKIRTKKYVWLTAYHFWLFMVMWPLLITLPLAIFGFDLRLFGILLSAYFSGLIVEDFTWFVVNPVFSFKHFSPKYVKWYPWLKIGKFEIPLYYALNALISLASWQFLWR